VPRGHRHVGQVGSGLEQLRELDLRVAVLVVVVLAVLVVLAALVVP